MIKKSQSSLGVTRTLDDEAQIYDEKEIAEATKSKRDWPRWTPRRDGLDPVEWKSVLGQKEIFRLSGSIYPSIWPRLLLSLILMICLKIIQLHSTELQESLDGMLSNPAIYQLFTYGLGFLLVFRVSLAYQRFWEARSNVDSMSSKWFDACLQAVTFEEFSEVSRVERHRFQLKIIGLFSLLHAEALSELGSLDMCFPRLQLLDEVKVDAQLGKVKDRVGQVLQWICLSLTERFHKHSIPAPVVSRLYQEISNGTLGYHHALKVKCTMFPFAFVQLVSLCLFCLMITFPFVVLRYVENIGWGMVTVLIGEYGYYALSSLAVELENPFGYDTNDLPLLDYQIDYDQTLVGILGQQVEGIPDVRPERLKPISLEGRGQVDDEVQANANRNSAPQQHQNHISAIPLQKHVESHLSVQQPKLQTAQTNKSPPPSFPISHLSQGPELHEHIDRLTDQIAHLSDQLRQCQRGGKKDQAGREHSPIGSADLGAGPRTQPKATGSSKAGKDSSIDGPVSQVSPYDVPHEQGLPPAPNVEASQRKGVFGFCAPPSNTANVVRLDDVELSGESSRMRLQRINKDLALLLQIGRGIHQSWQQGKAAR